VCVYVYAFVDECVCVRVCVNVCMCVCVRCFDRRPFRNRCQHMHVYVCMRVCVYACMRACVYACMCVLVDV